MGAPISAQSSSHTGTQDVSGQQHHCLEMAADVLKPHIGILRFLRRRARLWFGDLPEFVKIVEVGARDGLQNEKNLVPTEVKVELIQRLAATGLSVVEATSFVSPRWVPQLADCAEVMTRLPKMDKTKFPVLVPNMTGLERAIAAGAKEIAVFASASEGFSLRNINCSVNESLERYEQVCKAAIEAGIAVRGYVSCIAGCPVDGPVKPQQVARVAKALYDMGCYEVSLGDTIGVGTPGTISKVLEAVLDVIPVERVAVHMHDTYGHALANILVALQAGVSVVDSSVAGLGGCPYAEGATGNVPTEDVLMLLSCLGIETGVDLRSILETGRFISDRLGRPSTSRTALALLPQKSPTTASSGDCQHFLRASKMACGDDANFLGSSTGTRRPNTPVSSTVSSGCDCDLRLQSSTKTAWRDDPKFLERVASARQSKALICSILRAATGSTDTCTSLPPQQLQIGSPKSDAHSFAEGKPPSCHAALKFRSLERRREKKEGKTQCCKYSSFAVEEPRTP